MYKDVTVQVGDTAQILLPKNMSLDEGMEWLRRRKVEEEREIQITEEIDAFPLDGAYAFWRAISAKYGFAGLIPTPGFFSDKPPSMIGVQISPTENVQVPWGRLQIPGIAGYLQSGIAVKNGTRVIFQIGGVVKQKFKAEVAELARLTRELVKKESIYKGQAFKVSFPPLNLETFNVNDHAPAFLDLTNVKEDELIFSKEVRELVNHSLFTPIEKTEQCRQYRIPLKRGILLEGPYGTGKTQTAFVTAKKCRDNGWTFVYLKSVKELGRAILFAQQYEPAVIFAEDIDQVLEGGRDEDMNDILNTIDGVDSKGHELITVLTTNFVEKINPAMLRPGRLDAVIPVRPPDAEAVTRLLRLYSRGLINKDETLMEVGQMLGGHIPAVIREVVERAKLSAVARLGKGEDLSLSESDLIVATRSMLAQTKLIAPPKEPLHPMEIFGTAMGREVAWGLQARNITPEQKAKLIETAPELVEALSKPVVHSLGNGKQR